ncbi:hypothetical protein D1J60_33600 [Streptomyces sp. W1SF4]|nr:hypothetical protein D1J60_33600 [Streptomyces sp. W1SF4]
MNSRCKQDVPNAAEGRCAPGGSPGVAGHRIARKGTGSSQRLGRHRWTVERTVAGRAGGRRLHRRCRKGCLVTPTDLASTVIGKLGQASLGPGVQPVCCAHASARRMTSHTKASFAWT